MKVTDLMVGDLFKAVDYNSPFRITAIYGDVVQTQADYQSEMDGNWYGEAEIKDLVPIPLTEDILVKNGFRKESQTIDGDYCKYILPGFALNWCDTDGFWYQNGDITPNYVHQLQHLLRLCGIEKEIAIMSKREKDFIEAAYNNDRESSKQEQQFFVEGCEHGYQYALQHPHWIPVEEGLPPKMGKYSKRSNDVLVVTERKELFMAKYWYDGDGWAVNGFPTSKLTHWMEIVPPRKE